MPHPSPSIPANTTTTASPTPAAPAETPALGFAEMVYAALVALGGQAYLVRQAHENPRAFLALIAKLLAAELRPPRAPRQDRTASAAKGDASGAAQPKAAKSETAHPGAAKSETAQPGMAKSGDAAFLSLISKMLTAELRPSPGSRPGRAGATGPVTESPAAQPTTTHPTTAQPAAIPCETQPALSPSASTIAPAPMSTPASRIATALPSSLARASGQHAQCEISGNRLPKRLWQHSTRWRPTFSERLSCSSGSAIRLSAEPRGACALLQGPSSTAPVPGRSLVHALGGWSG